MSNLDCLPFYVIDYILKCDCLSYVDLCRLSSVSKALNCICKSNSLWKKKYSQMWPEFVSLYDAKNVVWKDEVRVRLDLKKSIFKTLSDLSAEYYVYDTPSFEAFLRFRDISKNHSLGCEIIIDELRQIINGPSHLYLTHKYYALRALGFIRHVQLERKWKQFLSLPADEFSVLEGACFISEWCQPTVFHCSTKIKSEIDDVVKLILEKIKQLFPNHPVLKQGILSGYSISNSLWSLQQCKDILHCTSLVMFHDLKFTLNNEFNCSSIDDLLIHEVFTDKTGLSMIVGIIYAAIVAKLGVSCASAQVPVGYILKYVPKPGLDEEEICPYVDILDNGDLKTQDHLLSRYNLLANTGGIHGWMPKSIWFKPFSRMQVLNDLAMQLVEFGQKREALGESPSILCNALELTCLITPHNLEHKILLTSVFKQLNMNKKEVRIHARKESMNVQFSVGMIMKHKRYNYRCVIYGWDETCSASSHWKNSMNVYSLKFQDKQPFYKVLCSDGTTRYASQENLELDNKFQPITNIKVGRYFESFHGNFYLPNRQLLDEYPDDIILSDDYYRIQANQVNPL